MNPKKLKILFVFGVLFIITLTCFYIYAQSESETDSEKKDNKFSLINNSFRSTGFESFYDFNSVVMLSPSTSYSFIDIDYSDTNFYSSFLTVFNSNKIYRSFFINKFGPNRYYSACNYDFVNPNDSTTQFSQVRINFPFLNYKKENIIPYLNCIMAIKILYIMNELKFIPRVSDAMRTHKNQLKYKRRGWSSLDISPHLIGLATDISRYSGKDKKFVEDLSPNLNLKFLQHGGRGNLHIHLQDQPAWKKAASTNKVVEISDLIDDGINLNGSVMYEYKRNSFKNNFNSGSNVKQSLDIGVNDSQSFNFYSKSDIFINSTFPDNKNNFCYSFYADRQSLLTFVFIDVFENKSAELSAGIFKQGERKININYNFLPKGIFKVKIFQNLKPIDEKIIRRV